MKQTLLFLILLLYIFFGGNALAQISPGELCNDHAFLEGTSNCSKCHTPGGQSTKVKCLECHKEIASNIAHNKGYHAQSIVRRNECSVCHNEHHGRNFEIIRFEEKKFNHAITGFPLKGVHRKQTCHKCHSPEFIKNPVLKKREGTHLGLNPECLNCHADYHQGKLSAKCADCHSFESFKIATGFDHNATRYPLLGKHITTPCLDCHKFEIINGKKTQKFTGIAFSKCTDCHKDRHNNKFRQNCQECHTEETFRFNKGMKAFDHDKTDFKLIGLHKQVECKYCHKGSLTAPLKSDQCQDCHADYHKGDFEKKGVKPDCNTCHNNVEGWSSTTYTLEDHNKTNFKLQDAHSAVSCVPCHKKASGFRYKGIGTECVDCHKNVHKGFIEERFYPKEDCSKCHNVVNWKGVGFDHTQKNFKLDGAHLKIECAACHYVRDSKSFLTQVFQGQTHVCVGCHKDVHMGQFESLGKGCEVCHSTDNWKIANFDHNTSRYKLDGEHKNVACKACHKPISDTKGKYIQYIFSSFECIDCHK